MKEEKIQAIECAVSTSNKRVPVIVGTGSNDTSTVIINSAIAEELGADGLLIVTPYYNKTTQTGLIEHFRAIASSVSIPIILYNVPSRSGMNITPETCFELSKINTINEACHYQLEALPLIDALFAETNPIPVKADINMLGFNFGSPRLPLVECSSKLKETIQKYLQ